MNILVLGLLSFLISPLCAAEIEHITKGTTGEKDRKKGELKPLLQQSFTMKPVNDLPLDVKKIICRNVKMLICSDLNIDRQSFLDAEQNPGNDWNKVKLSSLFNNSFYRRLKIRNILFDDNIKILNGIFISKRLHGLPLLHGWCHDFHQ